MDQILIGTVELLLVDGREYFNRCWYSWYKREVFQINSDSFEYNYELVHQIIYNIEVCRRAGFRLLIVCMGYVKRHIDIIKIANRDLDKDFDSGMMDGLTDDNKFQDVNIMGTIVHTVFQSNRRMFAVGLRTETQYEAGCSGFLDRMSSYFKGGGGVNIQWFCWIR